MFVSSYARGLLKALIASRSYTTLNKEVVTETLSDILDELREELEVCNEDLEDALICPGAPSFSERLQQKQVELEIKKVQTTMTETSLLLSRYCEAILEAQEPGHDSKKLKTKKRSAGEAFNTKFDEMVRLRKQLIMEPQQERAESAAKTTI